MDVGYDHMSLDEVPVAPEKPGERREVSPELGVADYNYNVATLAPGTRLSANAYHYHENQREFYHVLAGRVRVEVEDGAFVLEPDDLLRFDEGVPHLLHNPYDDPARVVAVGAPPAGRRPVVRVQSYEDLLAERYPDGVPTG